MERVNCEGYGYTRGYGSGRVEILSTGRVWVRVTVLCYGYRSGSKKAVPALPQTSKFIIPSSDITFYSVIMFVFPIFQ